LVPGCLIRSMVKLWAGGPGRAALPLVNLEKPKR
jgi:hypothetical protein